MYISQLKSHINRMETETRYEIPLAEMLGEFNAIQIVDNCGDSLDISAVKSSLIYDIHNCNDIKSCDEQFVCKYFVNKLTTR